MATARRITIKVDHAGEWRYKVQAGNWRIIESAEEGFTRKATMLARLAKKYPDVEIVEADV